MPTIDVTDQVCPLSFVKAKLAMEDLAIGERLEVRLRAGEALANVTRSFEMEGQRVVGREQESPEVWRVVVERQV
ncbi:MAG: sulfurtransferase TusA family protein [Candidatus Sumerlaeia bacterium]|nr:sulfurtransferase TusA family protein [Candidatus Sumerlaeia bacterium]